MCANKFMIEKIQLAGSLRGVILTNAKVKAPAFPKSEQKATFHEIVQCASRDSKASVEKAKESALNISYLVRD